ncbi:hypothetical protein LPP2_g14 [Leptolyngbya phage LPP-2, strain SPI]|uniref:Uncharacterized protein n=1 Tax=Leptolyngbya phage LPP-2, strain SPI TaxID=2996053 RepID=A0AAE9TFA6_9CAUD|nr:hypothetical protein LPP2_g14 [Leptolyngbya phage LPP-2 st. SPI]
MVKRVKALTLALGLMAMVDTMSLLTTGCEATKTDTYENSIVTCGRDELGMLTCKGKVDVR